VVLVKINEHSAVYVNVIIKEEAVDNV